MKDCLPNVAPHIPCVCVTKVLYLPGWLTKSFFCLKTCRHLFRRMLNRLNIIRYPIKVAYDGQQDLINFNEQII